MATARRQAKTSKAKGCKRKLQSSSRRWVAPLATGSLVAVVIALLASSYAYLSQPGRLPLRVVEVRGEFSHLNPDTLRTAAGRAINGGFFTCDMPRLRQTVLQIPWVSDVSIRRVWPDKLVMRVSEKEPAARWGDDGLISKRAVVFKPDRIDVYDGMIKLHGPQGSERDVLAFLNAVKPAIASLALHIAELQLDERRHWWLLFDNGLTVSLGRVNRDERLAQFLRIYPRLIEDAARRPVRVDMRYEHGFAVRWREEKDRDNATTNARAEEKA